MTNRIQTRTRNPAWWTQKHASNWNHAKSALERDWEQTKADFSTNRGEQLNQNAADTIQQSVGAESIPPLGVKTRPTDPKVAARRTEKALRNMKKESGKASVTMSRAHDDIARERVELTERVADARQELAAQQTTASKTEIAQARARANDEIAQARAKAADGIEKAHEKIDEAGARRDKAITTWREAEEEVRYGYSVRSRYSVASVWDEKLEKELRVEWDALDTGRSWNIAGPEVHRGWDYAGKQP